MNKLLAGVKIPQFKQARS